MRIRNTRALDFTEEGNILNEWLTRYLARRNDTTSNDTSFLK